MTLLKGIDNLDRRFAWSFLGFLLAGVFGGITIYTEFFRDSRPAIQFEVVSDSSVLDVREDVGELEVVYAGTHLRKSGQSLRVIVVRVANLGSEDVLKSYYDEGAPLGFAVNQGSIISAELQGASEAYLTEQLSIDIVESSRAVFSPVILGREHHFTIKILIIHPETHLPRIVPIGRVARVDLISLAEVQRPQSRGLLDRAFSGTILVQIVRLPAYAVGLVLATVILVVPVGMAGSSVGKRRRRRKVERFKRRTDLDLLDEDDVLFRGFVNSGASYLREVDALLSERADLDHLARQADRHPPALTWHHDHPETAVVVAPGGITFSYVFVDMLQSGLIEREEGHHRVKPRFEEVFREFQKFLLGLGD